MMISLNGRRAPAGGATQRKLVTGPSSESILAGGRLANIAESRTLPVVFGTVRVPGLLMWYGPLVPEWSVGRTAAENNLLELAGVPRGGTFLVSAHYAFCHGAVDSLRFVYWEDPNIGRDSQIRFSQSLDPLIYWSFPIERMSSGDTVSTNLFRSTPFGSKDVQVFLGRFHFAFGKIGQEIFTDNNPYKQMGREFWPFGLSGICHGFFENCRGILKDDLRLKEASAVVTRTKTTIQGNFIWNTAQAEITDSAGRYSMNAVHALYECVTDTEWGLGISSDLVDFSSAAAIAYEEGVGVDFAWGQERTVEEVVSNILAVLDAEIYLDNVAGKYKIKVIRPEVFSGVTFDNTNVSRVGKIDFQSVSETKNVIVAKHINPFSLFGETGVNERWCKISEEVQTITFHDEGAFLSAGVVNSFDITINYVTSPSTAMKSAQRMLLVSTIAGTSGTIYTGEDGFLVNVGDKIYISLPDYGLQIYARVSAVGAGSAESAECRIDFWEDYTEDERYEFEEVESQFGGVGTEPLEASPRYLTDSPYYFAIIQNRDIAETIPAGKGLAFYTGGRPDQSMGTAGAVITGVDGVYLTSLGQTGLIKSAINKVETSVVIVCADGTFLSPGVIVRAGTEYFQIISRSGTAYSVKRSVLDTAPVYHSVDDPFVAISGAVSVPIPIFDGSVSGKLLTISLGDLLSDDVAPVDNGTIDSRLHRPLLPGQFKIAGEYYPAAVPDTIVLTWLHRDRKYIAGVNGAFDSAVSSEPGVTYTVEVYDTSDDSLIYDQGGITGLTHSFDLGIFIGEIRIEVYSVRDTLESWQKYIHTVNYTGSGFRILETGDFRLLETGDKRVLE